MSRINEALRRVQDKRVDESDAAKNQHQFIPAWPVKNLEAGNAAEHDGAAAEPVSDGLLQPPARSNRGIVRFSSEWKERVAGPDGDPHVLEQFRRLAATLHHAHLNNGLNSVMVTSALPGDGKTLTSINLALVLAESYRYNVLLIDADLRQPSITNVVEIGEGSGLSEALRAPTEHKLALVRITPRLTLLPAGQPIANSIEALTSPRMRHILEEAAGKFDWVILDAPPVGPTTDARLLTQMVGGTLFVVRAGKTQHADVKKGIDSIGREQILGVVLNGVDPGMDEAVLRLAGSQVITAVLRHPRTMRAKRFVRDVKWRLSGVTLEEPQLPDRVQSILFVCLGNICRSPFAGRLAQQRFADLPIDFSSAGIKASQANKSPEEACRAAAEFGVSLENHRPVLLTPGLVQSSDLIVVMELAQLAQLRAAYPDAASRIVLLPLFDQEARGFDRSCIDDPFMRPLAEFRECFHRIDRSVSGLIARVSPGKERAGGLQLSAARA